MYLLSQWIYSNTIVKLFRATESKPTLAVRHILENRKRKAEVEKAEKRRRRFGKTKDGNWVSETYLNKMTTILGYPEILAAKALRHANNDINLAIDVINANPELLLVDDEDDPNSMVEFHSKFQNNPKFLQIIQKTNP